jgi:hypothetical protein
MLVAMLVDTRNWRRDKPGAVPDFESAANGSGNGVVWPSEKLKGRGIRHHAAAFAALLKNASRSVLIVSASVVGMPCGKPL